MPKAESVARNKALFPRRVPPCSHHLPWLAVGRTWAEEDGTFIRAEPGYRGLRPVWPLFSSLTLLRHRHCHPDVILLHPLIHCEYAVHLAPFSTKADFGQRFFQ
jgi:hypothetical protein